jgi:ArsR family metal-binding transcriptional regulator
METKKTINELMQELVSAVKEQVINGENFKGDYIYSSGYTSKQSVMMACADNEQIVVTAYEDGKIRIEMSVTEQMSTEIYDRVKEEAIQKELKEHEEYLRNKYSE